MGGTSHVLPRVEYKGAQLRCVLTTVSKWHEPISPVTVFAGEHAPMFFTLAYAAPEVILAYEAGQETHYVSTAADVWALGVIAFEMLTGERTFDPYTSKTDMLSAIAGRTQLPWEGPRRAELLEKLCAFQHLVLECLQRDPEKRPSIQTVFDAWEHLFQAGSA
jgi:serine/threonine protein kinase